MTIWTISLEKLHMPDPSIDNLHNSTRVKTGYLDSRGLGQTTQQYNLQSC